ncbi:hypothetical protein ShzoTeo12_53640 (plasmid) [Shinella zoogloeoides]|nr:hypothetical protein ShzoTeo12_53640 [Shinella zoogloeoides]
MARIEHRIHGKMLRLRNSCSPSQQSTASATRQAANFRRRRRLVVVYWITCPPGLPGRWATRSPAHNRYRRCRKFLGASAHRRSAQLRIARIFVLPSMINRVCPHRYAAPRPAERCRAPRRTPLQTGELLSAGRFDRAERRVILPCSRRPRRAGFRHGVEPACSEPITALTLLEGFHRGQDMRVKFSVNPSPPVPSSGLPPRENHAVDK